MMKPPRLVVRAVIALALAGVAGGSLVSCSGSSAGDAESSTLTFVTYTGGDGAKKYEDLATAFEAANPGVTVEMEMVSADTSYDQLIRSRIQGGTAPDIFEVLNGIPGEIPYVEADLLEPLGDEPWVSELIPSIAAQAEATGGETYSFTTQLNTEGVFYNKAIFDELGLTVPTTWEEFLATVETVKAAGIVPMSVGGQDAWTLWLQTIVQIANLETFQTSGNSESAALVDGSAKFSDSPEWREVLDDFTVLVDAGAYDANASGIDFNTSVTNFANGEAAMLAQGDFALPAVRTANPDLEIGYFPFPYVKSGEEPAVAIAAGGILAIPADAPNLELAKKFLAFLAEPENMTAYVTTAAALPTLSGIELTEVDPALAEILPAVESKSVDGAFIGLDPATTAALQTGLQGILTSTADTDAVLAAMDAAQAQ